jgi:hypothetical protein
MPLGDDVFAERAQLDRDLRLVLHIDASAH